MPRNTKIVNLSLPLELYEEVSSLAKAKGHSRSQILREALKAYLVSEKRWAQIRSWGRKTAERFDLKDENDLEALLHDYRRTS